MKQFKTSMLIAGLASLISLTSCRGGQDAAVNPRPADTAADTNAQREQAISPRITSPAPVDPANLTGDDALRYQEAMEKIRWALDLDPEKAAAFLGSAPVENLSLGSLEALGEKADQFAQQEMSERQRQQHEEMRRLRELRDQQEEQRRIREIQELQNIRRQ